MTTTLDAAPPDSVDTLLQRMVAIDTVNAVASGRTAPEAPLADMLERAARGWGFDTRRIPNPGGADNLLITHRAPQPDAPWLMFESHMDTVGVEGMTIEPFAAAIRDGRLYGRGSCDTKGTGAAMLWALRRYADAPPHQQPNHIALCYAADEEHGMTGVRSLVRAWPSLGFSPLGVIVGEPTGLVPIVAHNGCIRFRVRTRGRASHSSKPADGRNAVSMMAHVIRALEDGYIAPLMARDQADPLTGRAVASITIIRGGHQINVIPDRCAIDIDRRLIPGEDADAVIPAVKTVLDDLTARRPDIHCDIDELIGACPSLTPAAAQPLLPRIEHALASCGLTCAPRGAPYCTDAGDLAAAGIPTLVIGPGEGALAHTADESVALADIHQGVEFYLALMRSPRT